MAERLFKAIGREDMITDPRFRTNAARLDNVDAVDQAIQDFIGKRTLAENLEFFEKAEVTVGPVYDPSGFEQDKHVIGRGVLVEVPDKDMGTVPMHDVVPRLSRTPGGVGRPAPATVGKDTDEMLAAVGYDSAAVADLRARGIV